MLTGLDLWHMTSMAIGMQQIQILAASSGVKPISETSTMIPFLSGLMALMALKSTLEWPFTAEVIRCLVNLYLKKYRLCHANMGFRTFM